MNKKRKLLLAALLLIAFAAVKLVLLQWWQAQQPQAVAAQCDLTEVARCRTEAASAPPPFQPKNRLIFISNTRPPTRNRSASASV